MNQLARATFVAVSMLLFVAAPAWAGAVILEGGDVLRGEVTEQGDQIVVQHAALGRIVLRRDQVRAVYADEAPTAGPTLAAAPMLMAPSSLGAAPLIDARTNATLAAIDRAVGEPATRDTYVEPQTERDGLPVAGEAPKGPWGYGIGLSASWVNGNSETFDLKADADVKYERGPWIWEAALAYVYGEQQGIKAAENWHGKTRVERKISGCAYGFGQLTYDRDLFANLEHRWTGIVGAGTVLAQSKYASLKGEAGGGMTAQKRVPSAWRYDPSAYLGLNYLYEDDSRRRFVADLSVVPNLGDLDLSLTTLDMRFEIPCSATLNIFVALRLDWVYNPPEPGTDPLDSLFSVGFRFRQ